ncbi:hypothetical protein HYV57_02210 [Candidatus Peregrinibacteria bacterium]|nr:hypothetical protein [Candidatus Peregrinibacteria bacterium]
MTKPRFSEIPQLQIYFGSYAFSFEKSTYRWEAGARRSDTRPDQKGRKFAYDPYIFCHNFAHL